MNILQYLRYYTFQKFGNNLLMTFILFLNILKRTHLGNFFHHINNLHQNIKFTMEEESNGELAFIDALLKQSNGKIPVLAYKKPTDTD